MNSMEPPLTGLWAELQRTGGLRGSVFKSCESELMELMRQIDLMMESRKGEWNAQRQALQAKLEMREQESNVQGAMLEKKAQELGQLKQKVRDVERNQSQVIAEYERQVTSLRDEVLRMRKEYERVKKQYNLRSKEKAKAASELEGTNEQMQKLTVKLEEYRQKCRDLEQEKRSANKQIESLESQKRTLTEKCELVQQQTVSYQSQLDRRRDMLDSTEVTLRTQISQLEAQLTRSRENYDSQDVQLQKLRNLYEESMSSQRQALQEKEQLQTELTKARTTIRTLESDMRSVQHELSSQSQQIGANQSDQHRMQSDVSRLEQALVEKEANLQSLELERTRDRLQIVQELQAEINSSAKIIKKLRKTEQDLRAQLGETQDQLDQSRLECSRLTTELSTQNSEAQQIQHSEINKLLTETTKLKQQLEFARDNHSAEIDGMKRSIQRLTTDLSDRDAAVATVTEKASNMERSLRDQNETLDRKTAELELSEVVVGVANAQLEALRLENRHLRQHAGPRNDLDLSEAEGHLKDLETAYSSSLKSLEEQNKKLREDVDMLRQQLQSVQDNTHDRLSTVMRDTQQVLTSSRETEQRRVQEIQESSERRLRQQESNHEVVLHKYNHQVETLESQVDALERQLRDKNKTLQKLGLEHEVMTHFVDEVDDLVQLPPRRENGGALHGARINTSTPNPLPLEDDDSFNEDSVEVVTARFLAEQEERTKQLEEKLEAHIRELKADMGRNHLHYT